MPRIDRTPVLASSPGNPLTTDLVIARCPDGTVPVRVMSLTPAELLGLGRELLLRYGLDEPGLDALIRPARLMRERMGMTL